MISTHERMQAASCEHAGIESKTWHMRTYRHQHTRQIALYKRPVQLQPLWKAAARHTPRYSETPSSIHLHITAINKVFAL